MYYFGSLITNPNKTMKNIFILSAVFLVTACNNNSKVAGVKDSIEVTPQKASEPAKVESKETTTSSTASSESTNTAKKKKGWSKTAKGAVIGGVVGAGTGAVVNKKNRAAGAVVGGVVGAGAGAVIGNEMDKKDGRH
jgi:hypothetical protein